MTTENGDEAVNLADFEQPDVILMSISQPIKNKDIWQVLKELKETESTKHIPIIVLTGIAMSADRERALEAGCNDYDTWPINLERLLNKIYALLDRS